MGDSRRLAGNAAAIAACVLLAALTARAEQPYRSPYDLAFSPDGRTLAISDRAAGVVSLVDVDSGRVEREISLHGLPAGVAWAPGGARIYVAEYQAGTIAEVDTASGSVRRRFDAGAWPVDVAVAGGRNWLVTTDFALGFVILTDLTAGSVVAAIPAGRQPMAGALSPNEAWAVVGNHLPEGAATDPDQAARVTIIDLERRAVAARVRLPAGASNVRGIAVGPGGSRAYVVHTVGRTQLPTTQVERGWVNTNALSVIDLNTRRRVATVLLDALLEGAADPWGLAIAPDGSRLWITLSGVHQLVTIDLPGLSALLQRRANGLEDDLAALYSAGVIRRQQLPGNGPRGLAVSPDGRTLAVAMYFSGQVALLDADDGEVRAVLEPPNQPEADAVRLGEQVFHDATFCKQGWLSCATCHSDARVDGQNWDLLNDGLGNPKNARSLLWSYKTPPMMSLGVRATMEAASAAGFRHIAFRGIGERELGAVFAYLRSLEPTASPYRVADGPRAGQIERGRALFESECVGCARCHPAPLFTDLNQYDVGTRGVLDRVSAFDTPTLVELWRTGPYLHDGSAATLHEALVERNGDDLHGATTQLTEEEVADLLAYLLSL